MCRPGVSAEVELIVPRVARETGKGYVADEIPPRLGH
jgi:hypothetical protein